MNTRRCCYRRSPRAMPLASHPQAHAGDDLPPSESAIFRIRGLAGSAVCAAMSKPVDDVSLTVRAGQTLGMVPVVGESGFGQKHAGHGAAAADPQPGHHRSNSTPCASTMAKHGSVPPLAARHMQIVFQDPYGSLSPRLDVGQIVGEGLGVFDLGATPAEDRDTMVADISGRGWARPGPAPPLPARILRRPAPAYRHRPRHDPETEIRRAGRADFGPRPIADAGADRAKHGIGSAQRDSRDLQEKHGAFEQARPSNGTQDYRGAVHQPRFAWAVVRVRIYRTTLTIRSDRKIFRQGNRTRPTAERSKSC